MTFKTYLLISTVISLCNLIYSGHEVLYHHELSITNDDLSDNEIAIVQFDSRPLLGYWNASSHWNKQYAMKYHHEYIYLSMEEHEECVYVTLKLSPVWCKVYAMIEAERLLHDRIKGKELLRLIDS